MTMKNKYIKRSRITEAKFRELIRYFSLDLEAEKIEILTHLNRNTINRHLRLIRVRIAYHCEQLSPLKGEVEVDEYPFRCKSTDASPRLKSYSENILLRPARLFGTTSCGAAIAGF